MRHLYKAVLVAVVSKTGKEKSAVVRAISEVLKTVHNRAGPDKYRKAHPEEVLRHSLGEKDKQGILVVDFAKKSVKGKKRPVTPSMCSAEEPADTDEISTAAGVGTSDTQLGEGRCRSNPPRNVRPLQSV